MSEIRGNTPKYLACRGQPLMKFVRFASFRLNSSPLGNISAACSVFPKQFFSQHYVAGF